MGEIGPGSPRPTISGGGMLRTLILALCYIALVPVVSVLALIGAATYFPGPTKAFLASSLRNLGIVVDSEGPRKAEEALSKASALEDRLGKLESDIAELVRRAEQEPEDKRPPEAGQPPAQEANEIGAVVTPIIAEVRGRDRLLAALSSLTLARAELLAGNREVALRQLRLAQGIVTQPAPGTQTGVPAGLDDALAKGEDALSRGSGAAADWLSLAWHQLAEAILAGP